MQDVYKNIEEYNDNIIIVFYDMIADMINNKNLNPVVPELSRIRGIELNIYIFFITQSYFEVPKEVRLKTKLQQIAINHSSIIGFKDFMKIYKKYTAKPHSFLVIDTTLPSDNPLIF